ncbi:MAG: hypothetical protein B6D36_00295 [Planctomycetes bacterium UTPLA1]|jgi:hypothetical protein|nr:MAG: hypothetical protein B6D36_00295 [Planctomycetes bacterium UTPLA1]
MALKYEPLTDFLRATKSTENTLTLTFKQIELLIDAALPTSAYEYRPWWANQSDASNRPQARAWMSAGLSVGAVRQQRGDGWVRFDRR